MDKDKGKPDTDFRTSTTYFLPSRTTTLKTVDDRVASLTRVARQHQEYVQVLRYEHNQHYGSHHDYWDPDFYQSPEWLDMTQGGFANRLATVFWYMTDVVKGGETNFPRAHGAPDLPNTKANCATRGLSVPPKEGKVIVFYSLKPDGSGDRFSLHSACPVLEGTKWAANKWVWNSPKGFIQ
jgi:prolyl 4-hydroxylase